MAQGETVLAALPEDLSLVPQTPIIRQLTTTCNSSTNDPILLVSSDTFIHKYTEIHIKKLKNCFKVKLQKPCLKLFEKHLMF